MKTLSLLIPLLFAGSLALAAPPAGSVLVKTIAEQEQVVDGPNGAKSTELVPAAKVLPGHEVIYTVTFSNTGSQPAADVVVTNPVPAHTRYVPGSAFGPGTELRFSTDGGRSFAPADALTVATAEGTTRPATAADYTHIRFVLKNPLNPGAIAFARYRAQVE